jgi:hydroxyacylglutathione hydrolase
MYLRLLYDEKLAQASYLIGCESSGEALVVDPSRDIGRYVELARREGLRIAHVTETHIHADFVSGSRELAHHTGARLYLSGMGRPDWEYRFAGEAAAQLLQDGTTVRVGGIEATALHTPGHTPEHLTFVVTDTRTSREPMGALTGDFVFVGDVGRPDLLERAARQQGTMVAGARQLFASLQRFRELPDFMQIWPGHGAGSACGKSLGAVPQSTLGYEKRTNWAFAVKDEEEFVRRVLEGQPDPPRYFARMKQINRDGPSVRNGSRPPELLPAGRVAEVLAAGATVVDTRPAQEYARGAVAGTINIPSNRSFTSWAGWLLPYDRDLYLITRGRGGAGATEIARDLASIGLDRVAGWFDAESVSGGSNGSAAQTINAIDAAAVAAKAPAGQIAVLDVRTPGEWQAGHLPWATHVPLGDLPDRLPELPHDRPIVVHCQTGARAAIAASLLLARGFTDVRVFPGGFGEWKAAGREIVSR